MPSDQHIKLLTVVMMSLPACLPASAKHSLSESRVRLAQASWVPPAQPASLVASTSSQPVFERIGLLRILQEVRRANPQLRQARAEAQSLIKSAEGSARPPNPMLKYEQWAVPLARPWRLDQASMLMVGLQQEIPADLHARGEVAASEASLAIEQARAVLLDIELATADAYWQYALAEEEIGLHREHIVLTQAFEALVQSAYRSSRATQRDVLRASAEIARLENQLAQAHGLRRRTHARLKAILATQFALPSPEPLSVLLPASSVTDVSLSLRPEITSAERRVEKSQALLAQSKALAYVPALVLGADYMVMPTTPEPHGYGLRFGLSLPWLNPGNFDDVRAAEARLEAARLALEAERFSAVAAFEGSSADVESALVSVRLIEENLLPRSRQSYESSLAGFSSGTSLSLEVVDALRVYLDARMDRLKAIQQLNLAYAAQSRASGQSLLRSLFGAKP